MICQNKNVYEMFSFYLQLLQKSFANSSHKTRIIQMPMFYKRKLANVKHNEMKRNLFNITCLLDVKSKYINYLLSLFLIFVRWQHKLNFFFFIFENLIFNKDNQAELSVLDWVLPTIHFMVGYITHNSIHGWILPTIHFKVDYYL